MMLLMLIPWFLKAAIITLSCVIAFRCLFLHEKRREYWRSAIKHRIHFSQRAFRRLTYTVGWMAYGIFLVSIFQQVSPFLN